MAQVEIRARPALHPTCMFRLHFSWVGLQSFWEEAPEFDQYNCHQLGASKNLATQAVTSDPEYSSSRRR